MATTLVWVAALATGGCADPRSQRRLDAIDVGGDWVEFGGPSPLLMTITLQGSVNDLLVEIRGRPVLPVEEGILARFEDQASAAALRERVALGADDDAVIFEGAGGDNVSFDGGLTTTISVAGPTFALTDGAGAGGGPAVARYSLTLEGDAELLRGALVLGVDERVPAAEQVDGAEQRATRHTMALRLVPVPADG